MPRTVVITGIGLITPGGDREQAWAQARAGATAARPIDRFDAGPYGAVHAGVVEEEALERFPRRHRKRMDRFSTLALVAAGDALSDGDVDLDAVDRDRVGVSIGNMHGGWAITEPSLRKLLQGHEAEVSPYVASAWFPTAPQGQISIHWQLKGHSKTYAADTASGAHALGYAADAIAHGRADMVLAGGATAPITDYTYAFCARSGRLSAAGYRPFDERAEGFQIGEGAAILVLEEEQHALARGARVYGRLAGWATRHAARRNGDRWADGGALGGAIGDALKAAGVAPSELDYVALDAQGTPAADRAEAAALAAALDGHSARPLCTTTKPALTHLLGAAPATEAATTLLALRDGAAPPIAGCERPAGAAGGLNLVTERVVQAPLRTALLNARGADGVRSALVLTT